MFKDIDLLNVYDTSKSDIIKDLFCPLLSNSVKYKRGVGYFTSGWIKLVAEGLLELTLRNGKAQLITSPILEEKDWKAFVIGNAAIQNEILYKTLKESVEDLSISLRDDTLNALAWLVADGILEISFAIPTNNVGDFHDKFAIFEDEYGNKVAIHGSYNDSIHGTFNGESFSVFRSWIDGQSDYVITHERRFDELFENKNSYFKIFTLPEAIYKDIVSMRITSERPYNLPTSAVNNNIHIPDYIQLFDYQREAINKWFECGCAGIFEMATGTGKTIMSLSLAAQLSNRLEDRLLTVVCVPFNHLVDQWKKTVIAFGFSPILCRGNYNAWYPSVKSRVQDYKMGLRKNLVLITTHDTACSDRFINLLKDISSDILFIGDEVHYLGAPNMCKSLLTNYNYRVGLSATPERWFDEEGTERLKNYFSGIIFEYSLDKAIENNFLTPYSYLPQPVNLTAEEMENYGDITEKIIKLYNCAKDHNTDEQIKHLLLARSRIILRAENKLIIFERLLNDYVRKIGKENIMHLIVYCAPGETDEALKIILKLGLRAIEFIHTVPIKERIEVLNQFKTGDIQILVAIKCLDDGVDIPEAKKAYFLASTTNPREFVQRRGRLLRKYKGKDKAEIVDFIVIPPKKLQNDNSEHEKNVLKREMPRFAEFAGSSMNEFSAREIMYPILKHYDLLHLLDKKPWDVYLENKLLMEEYDE